MTQRAREGDRTGKGAIWEDKRNSVTQENGGQVHWKTKRGIC